MARGGLMDDTGYDFENDVDCTFCKHKKMSNDEKGRVWSECELVCCEYEEMDEEDDDLDDIADGIFERLKCIPDFEEKGVYHYGKCICGGTVKAIRSTYNGHLHAECNTCDFKLH